MTRERQPAGGTGRSSYAGPGAGMSPEPALQEPTALPPLCGSAICREPRHVRPRLASDARSVASTGTREDAGRGVVETHTHRM